MRKLNKYILKKFFGYFFATFFALSLILFVTYIFENLDWLSKGEANIREFLLIFLFRYPSWFREILPSSLLMSVLFLFTTLKNNFELLAIQSAGIDLKKIILPVLFFGVIFSFISFYVGEKIVPTARTKEKKIYYLKIKKRQIPKKTKLFNISIKSKKGGNFNMLYFDLNSKEGRGFSMDFILDGKIIKQILASKIFYKDGWVLKDVVERRFKGDIVSEKRFLSKKYKFPFSIDDIVYQTKDYKEMNFRELKKIVKKLKNMGLSYERELVDYYFRFSFPFACFIVMFWGIIFSIKTPTFSKFKAFFLSVLITFIYWGLNSFFRVQGDNGLLPAFISAQLTNIIFVLSGIYFILR